MEERGEDGEKGRRDDNRRRKGGKRGEGGKWKVIQTRSKYRFFIILLITLTGRYELDNFNMSHHDFSGAYIRIHIFNISLYSLFEHLTNKHMVCLRS